MLSKIKTHSYTSLIGVFSEEKRQHGYVGRRKDQEGGRGKGKTCVIQYEKICLSLLTRYA